MNKNITLDFAELNALNKLLSKVKFESQMDAEDLSFFATSPLIISVYEKVHLAYRESFSKNIELDEQIIVEGKNRFKLTEKHSIIVLKNRIENLTGITKDYIKNLNEEELDSYCVEIFAPFIPTEKQREEILNLLIEIKKNK